MNVHALVALDRNVLESLNSTIGRSVRLDRLLVFFAGSPIFKGDVVAAAFWWQWFRVRGDMRARRATLLAVMIGGFLAVVIGRWMTALLPFRTRPIHDPRLTLHVAAGFDPVILQGWSSFPSDHALMFVAVAVGFFAVSRGIGGLLLLHALALVCLPRVMMGLHYPSDVVAGGVIGGAVGFLVTRAPVRTRLAQPLLAWMDGHPPSFYAAAVLASIEVANLLESVRDVIVTLFRIVQPSP